MSSSLPARDPGSAATSYMLWLTTQPLAPNSQRAYRSRVGLYCRFLEHYQSDYGDPLSEPHSRDYAVRDYLHHLKTDQHAKPASIKLSLAALDHFYRFLELGSPDVRRTRLPDATPKALSPDEQKTLLQAIERCARLRDRAIMLLLFYTGIRIGECAALDMTDIALSARKGVCHIGAGKTGDSRAVPLNAAIRPTLYAWLTLRQMCVRDPTQAAVFLNRSGQRLSVRAIDTLVHRIAADAGLKLSAHVLRHTCLTNLVRGGHDLVLVAQIAGHRRLETTRRYSLPSAQDQAAAMESLVREE